MSECQSECDCGAPGGYPHEPDCHWWDKCEDGQWCDKHYLQAEADHAYLRGTPSPEQAEQDIRDAGRGHLLP